MKILPLLLLQVTLFIGYGFVQAQTKFNDTIYSPEKGIICDNKLGFCADKFGISMAFTKQFLGQNAQDRLLEKVNNESNNIALSKYTFSNNVYCDSVKQSCFTNQQSNNKEPEYNFALFE